MDKKQKGSVWFLTVLATVVAMISHFCCQRMRKACIRDQRYQGQLDRKSVYDLYV